MKWAFMVRHPRRWLLLNVIVVIAFNGWILLHFPRALHGHLFVFDEIALSLWLLLGPYLVHRWTKHVEALGEVLTAKRPDTAWNFGNPEFAPVRTLDACIPIFIGALALLIAAAYFLARHSFESRSGLPTAPFKVVVSILTLVLACVPAGLGFWAAARTLTLANLIAKHSDDFSPFEAYPSASAKALVSYCFWSAVLFGIAGAMLVPCLFAAATVSQGWSEWIILVISCLIIVVAIALLGWPAYYISRRYDEQRSKYITDLAAEIAVLDRRFADKDGEFTDEDYQRLRILLDLRANAVSHSVPSTSTDMVKRIPLAVIVPTSTALASWIALFH